MKILIRRSGGFAGPLLAGSFTFETGDMPPAQARRLESLLAAIPPYALHGRRFHAKGGADLMKYEVTIETPDGTTRFLFDESAVPEEFGAAWKLLSELMEP
jgi:hypothetical protein